MTLSDEIEFSANLSNTIGEAIDGIELDSGLRAQLGGALLHLGLTHHLSIVRLIDAKHTASAFALVRPMIDCFLRHHWVLHIASDSEVDGYARGDDPPSAKRILKQLEDSNLFDGNFVTDLVEPVWGTVCDFTHAGGRTLSYHLRGNSIEPSFEEREIGNVLRVANGWAVLMGCSVADLANNSSIGERMLALSRTLHSVRSLA